MKLSRVFLAVFLLSCEVVPHCAHADSWQIVVPETSVCIAPDHNVVATNAWVSGFNYDIGTYMLAPNGKSYWTPTGGTSTIAPTHRGGLAEGADGVQWLYLSTRSRRQIELVQHTSGDLYIERSGSQATTTGTGVMLTGKGSYAWYEGYSGEINAIAATNTITIGVQEF